MKNIFCSAMWGKVKIAETKKYEPTAKEAAFLALVENGTRHRGHVAGLERFVDGRVTDEMHAFFSADELASLVIWKNTPRDVEERMRVKITQHYFGVAKRSEPVRNLVKPRAEETLDLIGQDDPSGQLKYSPVPGVLHKYEMALIFVSPTCSAHCRYCYRSDAINLKTIGGYVPYDTKMTGLTDGTPLEISVTLEETLANVLGKEAADILRDLLHDVQLYTVLANNENLSSNSLSEFDSALFPEPKVTEEELDHLIEKLAGLRESRAQEVPQLGGVGAAVEGLRKLILGQDIGEVTPPDLHETLYNTVKTLGAQILIHDGGAEGKVKAEQKKGTAEIGAVVDYIKQFNREVEDNGGTHPETGQPKLREVLFSGGDPMVLSNKNLASWMAAMAEAGIEEIRIGTKELAFFPGRVGHQFVEMLDRFHSHYPQVRLRFAVHFTHPDEFLHKDTHGNYMEDEIRGGYKWQDTVQKRVEALARRGEWISMDNQTPIIDGVNNDPEALRIMQRELKRNGVENHYYFQGREIEGHRAFNVPVEEAWAIVNESRRGLSGFETHARFAMSTEHGKTEVVSVSNEPIHGVPGAENGFVVLKILRSPGDASTRGNIAVVGRNPEALWLSGYKDRVIMDKAGLFPGAKQTVDPLDNTSALLSAIGVMKNLSINSVEELLGLGEVSTVAEIDEAKRVQNPGVFRAAS